MRSRRRGWMVGTMGRAQLTGLSAGPGFDDVTGLGTPSARFYMPGR